MRLSHRILIPALLLPAATLLRADVTNRVHGKVTDTKGAPVADAKVVFKRKDRNWVKETTTDAQGSYSQIGLDPKDYEVTVSKDGFAPTIESFHLHLGEPMIKDFVLRTASEAAAMPGAVQVAPADPAGQADTAARKVYNDEAMPLVQAGKYAEAVPLLEKAYKDMTTALPDIKDAAQKEELEKTVLPGVEKTYGLTLFQAGKKEEALPLLEKVIALEPKNKNVLLALVQGYAAKKDKANEAKYQALLDAETGPRADSTYNKGVEAFNKGRMKEAKEHLTKALEIDPNFADAHYLLGLVDANGGNMAGVKTHFKKYLELAPGGSHAAEVKEMLAGL